MAGRSWLNFSAFAPEVFPIEVFGYPEDSEDEIIYHVIITTVDDSSDFPPLPERRMKMKLVLATGEVLYGTEDRR